MRTDPGEGIAAALRRRGLAAPARLLLDAHRPLRPLMADTLAFLSPALHTLAGDRLEDIEAALADDAAYARLLERLADRDSM